ncbi:MAG: hypothetical protein ACI9NN_000589, partial [Bacteroidia bacterium]
TLLDEAYAPSVSKYKWYFSLSTLLLFCAICYGIGQGIPNNNLRQPELVSETSSNSGQPELVSGSNAMNNNESASNGGNPIPSSNSDDRGDVKEEKHRVDKGKMPTNEWASSSATNAGPAQPKSGDFGKPNDSKENPVVNSMVNGDRSNSNTLPSPNPDDDVETDYVIGRSDNDQLEQIFSVSKTSVNFGNKTSDWPEWVSVPLPSYSFRNSSRNPKRKWPFFVEFSYMHSFDAAKRISNVEWDQNALKQGGERIEQINEYSVLFGYQYQSFTAQLGFGQTRLSESIFYSGEVPNHAFELVNKRFGIINEKYIKDDRQVVLLGTLYDTVFTTKGSRLDTFYSAKHTRTSLQVPIRLGYQINFRNWRVGADVGLNLMFSPKSDARYLTGFEYETDTNSIRIPTTPIISSPSYNSFNVSFSTGARVGYHFNSSFEAGALLTYSGTIRSTFVAIDERYIWSTGGLYLRFKF